MIGHDAIARDLVLIGGGHSHVILLRKLAMNPVPGLQITLISPAVAAAYSGMLPGVIAGHYEAADIHIDLVRLCRFAGARLFEDRATGIDRAAQTVQCEGERPDVGYDLLSIDTGITPSLDDVPGARDNVIAVKPINTFLARWEGFLERALAGEVNDVAFVGAGAGGVELCLAVQHRLQQEFGRRDQACRIGFHLYSDQDTILPSFDQAVQRRFLDHCARRDIEIHPDFRVAGVAPGRLMSEAGGEATFDEAFWVTAAAAWPWLAGTGLDVDDAGFVTVRDTLQSTNDDNVFAVGDIARMVTHPRPKAGVFAVRQGNPLDRNIRRILQGRSPKSWRPQRKFLSLISTGDKYAVASRNGRSVEGKWVWYWKDRIDRRFMRRFNELPPMTGAKRPGLLAEFDDQMHCGGCGAKVSGTLLKEVLADLDMDTETLDDAAVFTPPDKHLMVQTVDGFRSFVDDPWRFAQVTAHHALGDIYAMGGRPVSALVWVTLPFARPASAKRLLEQLLAGALAVFEQEDVKLIGGHTGEGAELALGFSINGICREEALLAKSGLEAGDALLLTKPLGTGAIFAADMQHRARGDWVEEALYYMCQSNREALDCLRDFEVSACTDVTGFGLAGHLDEMLTASGKTAVLNLGALPMLSGALAVINDMGITSSLHAANRAAVAPAIRFVGHRHEEILFDPQTAGGLLASVPVARAEACRAALAAAGYDRAAIIGRVSVAGDPKIVLQSRQ